MHIATLPDLRVLALSNVGQATAAKLVTPLAHDSTFFPSSLLYEGFA